jgi:hypothetical protein
MSGAQQLQAYPEADSRLGREDLRMFANLFEFFGVMLALVRGVAGW